MVREGVGVVYDNSQNEDFNQFDLGSTLEGALAAYDSPEIYMDLDIETEAEAARIEDVFYDVNQRGNFNGSRVASYGQAFATLCSIAAQEDIEVEVFDPGPVRSFDSDYQEEVDWISQVDIRSEEFADYLEEEFEDYDDKIVIAEGDSMIDEKLEENLVPHHLLNDQFIDQNKFERTYGFHIQD